MPEPRKAFLIAAVVNLAVAFALPRHSWSITVLGSVALIAAAWLERRLRRPMLMLTALVVAVAVASIAVERDDGRAMIYTFLGLCAIVGLVDLIPGEI